MTDVVMITQMWLIAFWIIYAITMPKKGWDKLYGIVAMAVCLLICFLWTSSF